MDNHSILITFLACARPEWRVPPSVAMKFILSRQTSRRTFELQSVTVSFRVETIRCEISARSFGVILLAEIHWNVVERSSGTGSRVNWTYPRTWKLLSLLREVTRAAKVTQSCNFQWSARSIHVQHAKLARLLTNYQRSVSSESTNSSEILLFSGNFLSDLRNLGV